MLALLDADIIRYEIGFAAESGWKYMKEEEGEEDVGPPPWDYVERLLSLRIGNILQEVEADEYVPYLTEGPTIREAIATTKPYKGTRLDKKPWHFDNLTVYLKDVLGAVIVHTLEADDAMAIEQCSLKQDTIICSRDKDLRQVQGFNYGWELGLQPSFGPILVDKLGWLELDKSKSQPKIIGCGYKFFASQVLTGDTVDNIPGLRGCGPVRAYELLDNCTTPEECENVLKEEYGDKEELLREQAQLCWIIRRYENGSPQLWKEGLYD